MLEESLPVLIFFGMTLTFVYFMSRLGNKKRD
jgi:hypothetical protein